MLRANAKKCLAALKSSTQINGFQHLFLLPLFYEANASGMVLPSIGWVKVVIVIRVRVREHRPHGLAQSENFVHAMFARPADVPHRKRTFGLPNREGRGAHRPID